MSSLNRKGFVINYSIIKRGGKKSKILYASDSCIFLRKKICFTLSEQNLTYFNLIYGSGAK
jgi:hypothetical protein